MQRASRDTGPVRILVADDDPSFRRTAGRVLSQAGYEVLEAALGKDGLGVAREWQPDLIVLEDVFSLEKYPQSGIVLGKVCGVLLLAGTQSGIPLTEVPVRQAKQILTGNGKATKEQLERAVRSTLGAKAPIRPFHASDALGLALIGLFRHR